MPIPTDSPPVLFVNSGVQLLCIPLHADQEVSSDQTGAGWQHCCCRASSGNPEDSIIRYGYIQWQIVGQKIFLAVDTSVGVADEGPPQYFAKASTLTKDVCIRLENLLDAQGKPFQGLPTLEFILRPADAEGGEDRQVHLVVDFGNSRTGGLLVEFRGDVPQEPMMTPLRLINRYRLDAWDSNGQWNTKDATWWFSSKTHWCTTPYLPAPELQVVVYRDQPKTGVFGGPRKVPVTVVKQPRTFEEHSQVRLGREADSLIGGMDVHGDVRTGLSSPKRYLWAGDGSWLEGANWQMADPFDRFRSPDSTEENRHVSKLAGPLLKFIPEDDLADQPTPAFEEAPHMPRHAPRVLMQAALYEILCQAYQFVNSPAYQELTGDAGRRRTLETLTLTFPSGMVRSERLQLQAQAEKAIAIFAQTAGRHQTSPHDHQLRPQLKLSIDEASAAHLTYLWSESRKLGGKPSLWFSVMGRANAHAAAVESLPAPSQKQSAEADIEDEPVGGVFGAVPLRPELWRDDEESANVPPPRSVSAAPPETRIACIDIGGGTSDLMIASYQCVSEPGGDRITGETLHRDGVSRAGDHLVQRLLEEIIVPSFCSATGIVEKNNINFLFGRDVPANRRIRRQRIHWMNHLFVPLAHAYLDAAVAAEAAPDSVTTESVITHRNPNIVDQDVVQSLQETTIREWGAGTYNVKQDMNLVFQRKPFERVVDEVFGELLFDFCESIVEHEADVVLLAGLPSKLPYIRQLVETYLPLAKSRIVPMHGWYAGTWYPYQNPDNVNPGLIVDPKSTVVVGAAIEFCARHGKLPQFDFRMKDTAAKSSFYWGVMTESRIDAKQVIFKPRSAPESKSDVETITVTSENLIFGRKRRDRVDSQASPVYRLRAVRGRVLGDVKFDVTLERQRDQSGEEELVIQAVVGSIDGQPAQLGSNVLFDWRTLADERYYLDTGGLDKLKLPKG